MIKLSVYFYLSIVILIVLMVSAFGMIVPVIVFFFFLHGFLMLFADLLLLVHASLLSPELDEQLNYFADLNPALLCVVDFSHMSNLTIGISMIAFYYTEID